MSDGRDELRNLIHRGIFKAAPMFAVSKMANFEQDIYDEILDRAADEILSSEWLRGRDIEKKVHGGSAYLKVNQDLAYALDAARDALRAIQAAVEMWEWVPERDEVLQHIREGLGE